MFPAHYNMQVYTQVYEKDMKKTMRILTVKFLVGKEGLEPSRPKAHDPKSCLSASSSTSPVGEGLSGRADYKPEGGDSQ